MSIHIIRRCYFQTRFLAITYINICIRVYNYFSFSKIFKLSFIYFMHIENQKYSMSICRIIVNIYKSIFSAWKPYLITEFYSANLFNQITKTVSISATIVYCPDVAPVTLATHVSREFADCIGICGRENWSHWCFKLHTFIYICTYMYVYRSKCLNVRYLCKSLCFIKCCTMYSKVQWLCCNSNTRWKAHCLLATNGFDQ